MNDHFENKQISNSELPSVKYLDYKGLDKDYLTAELIGLGIMWLVISIGVTGGVLFNGEELARWVNLLVYILLFSIIAFSITVTILGFKKKQYALRQHDIIYNEGLIWRTSTILPFNRIQHAEVHQGPIERLFDLGKIKIFTAGGSSSDLTISGIRYNDAQNIKYYVLNKAARDEEE